jgi:purine-binding chemotaxis protein CheW
MLGVLNLRGVVVPIIDLRRRFDLPAAEFTAITVIIVLSLPCAEGMREFGIVVDNVKDVVDVHAGLVKPAPSMSSTSADQFIDGIATLDEQMLILLNAERLVMDAASPRTPAEAA